MTFCNPFDATLAEHGPAAVFLPDAEGLLRFDESWTRDAWGRAEGPHAPGWSWVLLRDRATGYVTLLLSTSPTLVASWPRADVRAFATSEEAVAARAAFGVPPLATEAW